MRSFYISNCGRFRLIKTLKKTNGQIDCSELQREFLIAQYELLRQQALDPSQPGRGQGMIVLMTRGLSAWIHALSAQLPALSDSPTTHHTICATASPVNPSDREWLLTLTALVVGRSGQPVANLEVQHG